MLLDWLKYDGCPELNKLLFVENSVGQHDWQHIVGSKFVFQTFNHCPSFCVWSASHWRCVFWKGWKIQIYNKSQWILHCNKHIQTPLSDWQAASQTWEKLQASISACIDPPTQQSSTRRNFWGSRMASPKLSEKSSSNSSGCAGSDSGIQMLERLQRCQWQLRAPLACGACTAATGGSWDRWTVQTRCDQN